MTKLTPEEKQTKFNTAYKDNTPWIDKILMYMKAQPELTPSYIGTEEFRKDFEDYLLLQRFRKTLIRLKEGVEDTSLVIWKDVFDIASTYFHVIEVSSKNDVPGSTTIYEDLKVIFEDRGRKKKGDNSESREDKNPLSDSENLSAEK